MNKLTCLSRRIIPAGRGFLGYDQVITRLFGHDESLITRFASCGRATVYPNESSRIFDFPYPSASSSTTASASVGARHFS